MPARSFPTQSYRNSVSSEVCNRTGEMMRLCGMANGHRIVPEAWVRDTVAGVPAGAWSAGKLAKWLPKGRYRNKWYQTGAVSNAFFAVGIHGQWLYVDPSAKMVVAKFSSQPMPVSNEMKYLNLALFGALANMI
jgi:CubicO group peptidase (beta-lactamase class C family)